MTTYHTGRESTRSVYAHHNGADWLVGTMDTPELGAIVAEALNANSTADWCVLCGRGNGLPHHRGCPQAGGVAASEAAR